ncbi:MAG: endonuclease/exonuclease/phosphatase family protein [Fimbriimonadaceae bacterium]|nr:endonuclease/exonuclease/phosphatase family protein [Fimbriimonadaceae bacterium]
MASRAKPAKKRATPSKTPARAPSRSGLIAAWLSVLVAGALSAVYALEPEGLYALTVWPAWVWLPLALVTTLWAFRRSRLHGFIPLVVWLAFAIVFVDEAKPLLRSVLPSPETPANAISVASLNCEAGSGAALVEAISQPDTLVLLQESPYPALVRQLAETVWGKEGWGVVTGLDASIFAQGKLEALELPAKTSNFVAAKWTRPKDPSPVYVVSLRLSPPVLRFDYWNPECWAAYARDKRSRTKELAEIVSYLRRLPPDAPLIVGGDFNSPPDRTIEALLRAGFVDTFEEAGRGWGATGTNDTPVVRVDQIWVRRGMGVVAAGSHKSHSSDHRMATATVTVK